MLQKTIFENGGANKEAALLKNKIIGSENKIFGNGKTYFFSENGDNSFEGLESNKPKKTVDEIKNLELHPGDAILFERGSTFRLSDMIWLQPGVFYGAYGNGEKPVFLGSLHNYAQPLLWKKADDPNIWIAKIKGEQRASLTVFDEDSYFGTWCFLKEDLRENGDFFHDNANGLFYLYLSSGNPGEVFERIEIATTGIAMRASFINGMKIDNISFKYFTQGSFLFGECNDISITNCMMGWQGGKIFEMRDGKPLRYGNAAEFWYQCRNINVTNCYVYQIFDAALTFQGFGDAGPIFENISFVDNLIEYCSMNLEYWAGNQEDTMPPHIKNISYTGNIIRFCGYGWGGIQRFDKEDQALLLGWNRKYQDVSEFLIADNILDCSNGYYIYMFGPKEQKGITLTGNSYYQKLPTGNHNYTDIVKGKYAKANNQKEFFDAIILFDDNPKSVKWIE